MILLYNLVYVISAIRHCRLRPLCAVVQYMCIHWYVKVGQQAICDKNDSYFSITASKSK